MAGCLLRYSSCFVLSVCLTTTPRPGNGTFVLPCFWGSLHCKVKRNWTFLTSLFQDLILGKLVGWQEEQRASQVALVVKNLPVNAGDIRDEGWILGPGRSPGRGHGNLLQYSCLENLMKRGAWQATVMGSQRVGHYWSDLTCTHAKKAEIGQCQSIEGLKQEEKKDEMPQVWAGDGDNPQSCGDLCCVRFNRHALFLESGVPAWGDRGSWTPVLKISPG